ncbi:MAG: helix-turn-helix domain-containing protein, partial [Myxococcota bacterium]
DLYYRLRVVEVHIPPLRERRGDIPVLAHHFLDASTRKMDRAIQGFTNAAMDLLCAHGWSGNVRELENEIERCVALAGDARTIGPDLLSDELRGGGSGGAADPGPLQPELGELRLNNAVDALKRHMIQAALAETGSKTRAAEKLGIPRQSLQKMMKRLAMND